MDQAHRDVSGYGELDSLTLRWGWMLTLGILLMISGVYAASYAVVTSVIGAMIFGAFLMLSGILHLFAAVFTRGTKSFVLAILVSLVSLAAGAWVVYQPVGGVLALSWVFAAFLLISGFLRIVFALTHRQELNWGWLFVSGLLSMVLGGLIFAHWPISGLWIIGLYIGVDLFLAGWSMAMLAWAARQLS